MSQPLPIPIRLLILGGTTEASALARGLSDDARFAPVLSYAGRTRTPAAQPVPVRVGGFGGAAGLRHWVAAHGIRAVVDATHPFAARISAHAATVDVPRLVIVRPAWVPVPGDRWTVVPDMEAAAAALGPVRRRVFLTVGGTDLLAFAHAPHDLLVRAVDPPATLPAGAALITARGPFDLAGELAVLRVHRAEVLVTKNAGGTATAAKLEAARRLGLPVVMVARPPPPPGPAVGTAAGALAWLHALTERGV